jgi:hypothetical protein
MRPLPLLVIWSRWPAAAFFTVAAGLFALAETFISARHNSESSLLQHTQISLTFIYLLEGNNY